ncbi:hypothetical protein SAMN04489725_12324 [Alicyclobacillus hesperidum]|uniref:Flp pilus assembly protein TadB n=1 Tax=Alicyclobacillus hesperidum TaxID=89784 RepID=A0A1H2XQV7_9BACL|nr:hypothetical protein [Alicyclobacillus hesperidum]SDW94699.1 hypothetical protein SAMN04489725_12324 [Alicyclobacillus hesperidum]
MGYVILALGLIPSALLVMGSGQGEYAGIRTRARIAAGWYGAKIRVRKRLEDELLVSLLRKSGLSIKAYQYHYLRMGLTLVFLLFGVLGLVHGRVLPMMLPFVVWFGLEYRRSFPMYYGFLALQKQAAMERDKALYLLYRLLLQEAVAFKGRPLGVYDMIRRQLHRVSVLRPFLERCLHDWVDDPALALQRFGDEVGTSQAKALAQMLTGIEEAGVTVALDVLQTNLERFRADRIAAFRAHLNARALLATALTMLGIGATSFDLMVVIQIYSGALMRASVGG